MISVRECPRSVAIKKYEPLVRRIALQFIVKLPANIELDDLVQVGRIGLAEALTRFDPSNGAQFETFARARIRGAMFDHLRGGDFVSKSHRRKVKLLQKARAAFLQEHGRNPTDSELAKVSGISVTEIREINFSGDGSITIHIADIDNPDTIDFAVVRQSPEVILAERRRREKLVAVIRDLPERMRLVMEMMYDQDLNLKEIGEKLGVTESRACQLHGQILERLRVKMGTTTRSSNPW